MAEPLLIKVEYRVTDEELLRLLGLDPTMSRIYSVRDSWVESGRQTIVSVVDAHAPNH